MLCAGQGEMHSGMRGGMRGCGMRGGMRGRKLGVDVAGAAAGAVRVMRVECCHPVGPVSLVSLRVTVLRALLSSPRSTA